MKIIFMGTPEPAAHCLKALLDAREDIIVVVTQPDRPKGRGLKVSISAVKEQALKNDLKLLQPENVKDKVFISEIRSFEPDLIVVVAFGKILPKEILDIPKNGCVNVHASLLPKYRGAAPVQWAILNGEKETGISIFKLAETLDTGDIIAQKKVSIDEEDTSSTLTSKLFDVGAKLLVETVSSIGKGTIRPIKQNDREASYAPTLKKELGVIDWKQPAKKIHDKIRALDPWPGAYTFCKEKILKIWGSEISEQGKEIDRIVCKPGEIIDMIKDRGFVVGACDGSILILEVQPESGKRMPAYQFAIGHGLKLGDTLPN